MSSLRNRTLLGGLLTVALVAAIAVTSALGAAYGRGTFTGKAESQFDNDRPKTPIEIKVKGNRARIVKAVFIFDECGESGGTLRRTVALDLDLDRRLGPVVVELRLGLAREGAADRKSVV